MTFRFLLRFQWAHVFALLGILLVSCSSSPVREPRDERFRLTEPKRADPHPGNTASPPKAEQIIEPAPERETAAWPLEAKEVTIAGVSFNYVAFDSREHTLRVVDQAGGPGSEYQTAAAVTEATGALATINAGFFTPDGKPLGLVYEDGKAIGSLNTASSLGSGVLYTDEKLARPVIVRRSEFQRWLKDEAFDPDHVLQTGPYLVEGSRAVSGLAKSEPRVRSLLLSDGKFHFAIAQCGPISLPNLAKELAKQPLDGFDIRIALNLDGGRSADLNVSSRVRGGPVNLRRWWNKPVRNYFILVPQ